MPVVKGSEAYQLVSKYLERLQALAAKPAKGEELEAQQYEKLLKKIDPNGQVWIVLWQGIDATLQFSTVDGERVNL